MVPLRACRVPPSEVSSTWTIWSLLSSQRRSSEACVLTTVRAPESAHPASRTRLMATMVGGVIAASLVHDRPAHDRQLHGLAGVGSLRRDADAGPGLAPQALQCIGHRHPLRRLSVDAKDAIARTQARASRRIPREDLCERDPVVGLSERSADAPELQSGAA